MRSSLHKWAWLVVPFAYTVFFCTLSLKQHASFHTYALDMGQFVQAIWNTAHGRFMVNTLKPPNSMAWHFSPGLALIAPLYSMWPDARLLLVLQTLALALSGLPIYWYARRYLNVWQAAMILAAYYLAPSLHKANLAEFRRISLAVPGIALAWYGLVTKRYSLTTLALLYALLFKEDVSLIAISFGAYLCVKPPRKWGLGLAFLGLAWLALALFVFIPMFRPDRGNLKAIYPQLSYFGFLGDKTTAQAIASLVSKPWALLKQVTQASRLKAILRVLWPTGFLPLLAPGIGALLLPSLLLMLASSRPEMYMLDRYYMAPLLPLLYGAAVVGLTRLSSKLRPWAACWMTGAALVGFLFYSPAPGGRGYSAERYRVEPRHRIGHSLLRSIPSDAVLSAQCALVPHVSNRREIFEFPRKLHRAEYVALDLEGHLYPLDPPSYAERVKGLLADPEWSLVRDCSGFVILKRDASWMPASPSSETLGNMVQLMGFDWATVTRDGCFLSGTGSVPDVEPGQMVRVTLWWRAVGPIQNDYSVFVHLVSTDGLIIGQHDGPPGSVGRWPDVWAPIDLERTSGWQHGETVEDVHYMTLDADVTNVDATIEVGWYDASTGRRLTNPRGRTSVEIGRFSIR
ncbi:MAG TPA: DUF2079 domain-containing protein [Anaerolineae bacterium]|nr:DUF2079 domain-containing protein [Anaerolineae bacterium]